ncbi:MAG: ABC transporter substrate-binding protein [Candidatus Binatia bacterium]
MVHPKILSAVTLLCATFLAGGPLLAQELRRIHYGTTTSSAHLPVWVAKDAGFFAKAGLNVEPIQIRGGALITMGIMSGQLQFSGAGAESIVAARIEGGDVVLLACPVDSDPVYLITRPEIKSTEQLKGKATAVTRLGSTTHFYLRAALRQVGLDPEKDLTILQLGTGTETSAALENGRIAVAALTIRYALPFLQRKWPMLVDLSTTELVYPASCVASSRAFVKAEQKLVEDFLRAYVAGIQVIKKDRSFTEKSFAKWLRDKDTFVIKQTVESYTRLFKTAPYVPDKGIETVIKDLASRRPVSKEFIGRPELFRDNNPLEKALSRP